MKTELSNKTVVVVGNGSSLLNGGHGAWIDGHDIVVRFNLFQINGFSEDVGTKTSIWFNNRDAESTQIQSRLLRHTYQRIYVHTWNDTENAIASFQRQLQRLSRITPVIPVNKEVIPEMTAYLGKKYSMFSTGAIGTWIMLKGFGAVHLIGFDWWQPFKQFHYCDTQKFECQSDRGHQPLLEKAFFEKLLEEKRLEFH